MNSEEELVKAVLKGDSQAFQGLVEQYQSLVFAIIYNFTKDYQETENLAQETFIQVYRSLPQYNFQGFKAWIGRIATNKSIDWKRKQRKLQERQMNYSEEVIDLNQTPEESIEEQIIKREELKKVKALCGELPSMYQDVVEKFFIQEKSYEEIAQEAGISIRTVETRLYRAKKMLRKSLEEVVER
ncbi:MAG: RNA polymerase sigma factor [Bacillota bacterium]|nr:RNA polymerase sigma factor [Bacillota bacterium]